ncbi:hypothetical protein AJ78_04392 [Emergomyces pasteurianus Ep9510]|uniref:Uncharacterized protein n=1 Tax=Emergomyces pasteurianus Ep9510 TaxID=1447872 RepID=A0A1J9Q554_9EURO|nr:hypothetical protein AJ78_04392 [Emergomyces pasteurianus Ep9510]
MKLTLLATLALIGTALAAQNTIPNGKRCKMDESLGFCESGYCEQLVNEDSGICKNPPKKND